MHNCEKCKIRSIYEKNPRSLIGRIWKWHTTWCPGWKKYMASQTEQEKEAEKTKA